MKKKPIPSVSDAELIVMKALWDESPRGSAAIVESLESTGWSPTTIRTMLARLVKKGAVRTSGEGARFLYEPEFSRADYSAAASRDFGDKLLDGISVPVFAQFLSKAKLSEAEIDEIERILRKKRGG